MKAQRPYLIALIFIISATGCEKQDFDYRNKFLGNYIFSIKKTISQPGLHIDTTYSYKGNIGYGNSGDHSISINFSNNLTEDAILYEDGSISYQYLSGEFESTKHVHFKTGVNGLVGSTSWDVTGEKTK